MCHVLASATAAGSKGCALVSVSDKAGLEDLAKVRQLLRLGKSAEGKGEGRGCPFLVCRVLPLLAVSWCPLAAL